MRFIPFFISLVFAIPATAQETYEDIKRRQENKAYNEAYIDALRRPNTKTTNSGAIDQKAAQELADLFAARAGKETAAQKAAREKMEQERYDAFVKKQEAAYQEYRRQADTKQAEEDMIYGPFRKKYELAGFSFGEAEFLALDAKGGHFPAALALQQFNETVGTAGFEDLFHLVNDFKFTGYSAMKAVDQLKKRFPEKKVLLDAAAINLMIGSWTARVGTRYAYSFLGKDIQSKMLNYFEEAYDKNPELVFAQINAFRLDFFNNPFQLIAYEYSTKKKNKQAEKFRDLNGRYVMHVLKGPIITDRTIPGYFGDAYRYVGGYKITADDLREIAVAVKNQAVVTPRILIEYFLNFFKGTLATMERDRSVYSFKKGALLKSSGFDVLIKQMADEGDMEALNAYALMVSAGMTKEPRENAIAIWTKLADQGMMYAMYNLVVATQSAQPIKGYGLAQQPPALARWDNFNSPDKELMKEWTGLGGKKLLENLNYFK